MRLIGNILCWISTILAVVFGALFAFIEGRILLSGDFAVYSQPGLGFAVTLARLILAISVCIVSLIGLLKGFSNSATRALCSALLVLVAVFYASFVLGQAGYSRILGIAMLCVGFLYSISSVITPLGRR